MIGSLRPSFLTRVVVLGFFIASTASFAHGQSSNQQLFRITKINFEGLHNYTTDQAVAASGLTVGEQIKLADLQTSANHLLASGLFKRASYRYLYDGADLQITFDVDEQSSTVPIIFDNFVWFSDAELASFIKRPVPSFSGTAPESGPMLDEIKTALQQLLNQKGLPGRVDYLGQTDVRGRNLQQVYSVTGVDFRVCKVTFPGANPDRLRDLLDVSKSQLRTPYSRAAFAIFAPGSLAPIYFSRGYLKASFAASVAELAASGCAKNGVNVSIAVTEGKLYKWTSPAWSGNTLFSAEQLSGSINLKPGEPASSTKLSSGLDAIRRNYGKKGYIMARISPHTEFDEAASEVTYHLSVDEGKQFRMGKLDLTGLPEDEAKRIQSSWKLESGSIFDSSYLEDFLARPVATANRARSGKRIFVDVRPNQKALTVDVVITQKD